MFDSFVTNTTTNFDTSLLLRCGAEGVELRQVEAVLCGISGLVGTLENVGDLDENNISV